MKKIISLIFIVSYFSSFGQLKNTPPLFEEEIAVTINPIHNELSYWANGWIFEPMTGSQFDNLFLQTDVNLSKHFSNETYSDLFMAASSYMSKLKRMKSQVKTALDAPGREKVNHEYKENLKNVSAGEAALYAQYLESLKTFRAKYQKEYANAAYDETTFFIRLTPEKIESYKSNKPNTGLDNLQRFFYKTEQTLYSNINGQPSIRVTIKDLKSADVAETNLPKVFLLIEKALKDNGYTKRDDGKEWIFTKGSSSPADVKAKEVRITASDFKTSTQALIVFNY